LVTVEYPGQEDETILKNTEALGPLTFKYESIFCNSVVFESVLNIPRRDSAGEKTLKYNRQIKYK
jgi:hypothetical protein